MKGFKGRLAALFFISVFSANAAIKTGGDFEGDNHIPSVNTNIEQFLPDFSQPTTDISSMLGERVDLSTGALSFYVNDISINGNNGIPINIGRRFKGAAGSHSFWFD